MGHTLDEIPDFLISWIKKQHIFWVASAPLTADGLVNISPKGVEGTFHVVNSHKVWYEDLSGSGVETIAHIRENGRITVLFNAFDGPPRIARLYGKGTIYEFGTPEYDKLLPKEIRHPGSRAAIIINVFKVSTTCGYSVPFYTFRSHRTQLLNWAAKKEAMDRESDLTVGFSSSASPRVEAGLKRWWEERNTLSLDGLPGVISAHVSNDVFRPMDIPVGKEESDAYHDNAYIEEALDVQNNGLSMLGLIDIRLLLAFLAGALVASLCGQIG